MRKLTGNGSVRLVKKENARVSLHLDVRLGVRLGVDGEFWAEEPKISRKMSNGTAFRYIPQI